MPCDLFLQKRGTIAVIVTGPPQYSRDLDQGWQDVPCKLVFSGPVKDNFKQKVQILLQKAPKIKRIVSLAPPATSSTEALLSA